MLLKQALLVLNIFFSNIRRVLIKNKLASCHFPALDM